MKIKIVYPEHIEALDVEPVGENFRLKQHSYFLPLAPGDIVSAKDGKVTGVITQQPVFMIEAFFPINTPPEHVRQKAREWRQATDVTQPTALTVLVTSTSHEWLKDTIEPAVWWVELLRVPNQEIDFREKVQQA
jgi:hypothetical protein